MLMLLSWSSSTVGKTGHRREAHSDGGVLLTEYEHHVSLVNMSSMAAKRQVVEFGTMRAVTWLKLGPSSQNHSCQSAHKTSSDPAGTAAMSDTHGNAAVNKYGPELVATAAALIQTGKGVSLCSYLYSSGCIQ